MKITNVNNLNRDEFVKIFGNIVECFPKVAYELYSKIPFADLDTFLKESETVIDDLSLEDKEFVLQSHPDLAGKLADEGKLTNESTQEQKAAGLDNLSAELKQELNDLNKQYTDKFGFPFVICARENKAQSILNGLRQRLTNNKDQELLIGINEVKKICKLRVQDIIEN